ncbi:MAG: hypothetical protein RL375_186 [Pseudomonadota bacterium]|jgi:hypothetical protein
MANNILFKIETLIVDGAPVAIEDGSGSITGAARFENDVVVSASGDDFQRRKRVPTTLDARILFGPAESPDKYSKLNEVQITGRDISSGRRALMPKCSFGRMGAIGGGPVDVSFNVLAPIQWL